jgi:4-amino-4-deoxy-L-arabinose transferase-like glycosyltransferase
MATESSIQTAVWNIELGRGKRVIQWVAATLFGLFFGFVWYPAVQFNGLEKREAMDMAQLARNIARGQGFTTYCVRPLSLWQLKSHTPSHDPKFMQHPDLYNPPLYPLVLAAIFKFVPENMFEMKAGDRVYGPERWIILPFNAVCLFVTLLLVYFWAKQLFDQRVAAMAGLLLLVSDTLWSYAVSGLPTNFLTLLVLLSLYCLYLADRRLNRSDIPEAERNVDQALASTSPGSGVKALVILSAVLLGLGCLTRYLAGFLAVPFALYVARIFSRRKARGWLAIYIGIVLALVIPWLVRNYVVSRNVLGIATYQFLDGETSQRTYHADASVAYSFHIHAREFLVRARRLVTESIKQIGSDFLIFFFAVGLMYSFRRRDAARLRAVLVGCLAAGVFGMAFVGWLGEPNGPEVYGANVLVLFLPPVAVYGVAFFYLLLDRISFRMRLTRTLTIAAFVALNIAPVVFTLLPPRRAIYPYPPYVAPVTYMVAGWFDKDEAGTSDLPWAMAWEGDRRTLWLPVTMEEFHDIDDYVVPKGTKFMLLTPYLMDQPLQSELLKGPYRDWAALIRGQIPSRFPLRAATLLPPGEGEQVLLADRPRWKDVAGLPTTNETTTATSTNARAIPPAE